MHISHHERVEGHPHRWRVFLHGREEPVHVELPHEERQGLEMSDEDIHNLLPSALQKHATENRDDELYDDVSWDSPVRVMQTHFIA